MKKNIMMIAVLITLMVLGCSLCACAAAQADVAVILTTESGETVEMLPVKDTFYLPSAVDLKKIRFSYEGELSYS